MRTPIVGDSPFAPSIADYAHNAVVGTNLRRLRPNRLDAFRSVELVDDLARRGPPRRSSRELSCEGLRRGLSEYARRHGSATRAARPPTAPVRRNLDVVAVALDLADVEREILQLLLAMNESPELRDLMGAFGYVTHGSAAAIIAAMTRRSADEVRAALTPSSRLVSSGILSISAHDLHPLPDRIEPKAGLLDAVLAPRLEKHALLERYLPDAGPPTLGVADFSHAASALSVACQLLSSALATRKRGVNILLYGSTGTGKTELARILAIEVGAKLFAAGSADDEGGSPNEHERLSSLMLGQRLVSDGASLLLFDELEDLFRRESFHHQLLARHSPRMSKLWFNRLLETNAVPTIWITNEVAAIDRAFLRRFMFVIELAPLGVRHRSRVLARHLGGDSSVTATEIQGIVERHRVSPAQLASAVDAATMIAAPGGVDGATLERVLTPLTKMITRSDPGRVPVFDPSCYRLDATHTTEDLALLASRLAEWHPRSGGLSLCFHGPPGTGKSEYARYLAHRMRRRVVVKRGSDLLSKWVGVTEQQIAEAFREAENDDAVLLFDEIDSLLRDRRLANNSWEITQVNELLQQLETFRGVVACTTNAWQDLDEAVLRRFVFKVEFKFLRPEHAVELFSTVFAAELEGASLAPVRAAFAPLTNLAPGDIAIVARRMRALSVKARPEELIEAVVAEARAKPSGARAIGFDPHDASIGAPRAIA